MTRTKTQIMTERLEVESTNSEIRRSLRRDFQNKPFSQMGTIKIEQVDEICASICNFTLRCGHPCQRIGCNGQSHQGSTRCRFPCKRTCVNEHYACVKFCFQPCDPCKIQVKMDLPCGHEIMRPCDEAGITTVCICTIKIGKKLHEKKLKPEFPELAMEPLEPVKMDLEDEVVVERMRIEYPGPTICLRTCERGHTCWKIHLASQECPHCQCDVNVKLVDCRHVRATRCADVGKIEKFAKCELPCLRRLYCDHYCTKQCWEDCNPCQQMVQYFYSRCVHSVSICCSTPCSEIPKCDKLVKHRATCGHEVVGHCCDRGNSAAIQRFCPVPCTEQLLCGHSCTGRCGRCQFGQFHRSCAYGCGKLLICGHYCDVGCPSACSSCDKPCEKSCEHGTCDQKCGFPCRPCQEPCAYACPHWKCTRKCSEICDRLPCEKPCSNILECGHSCIGFCGEVCPPLCFICNKDQLDAESTLGVLELDANEDYRFICLEKCGHTIESSALTQWMKTVAEDEEIKPKQCPVCRSSVWNCRRFGSILIPLNNEILAVKNHIYGDPEVNHAKARRLAQRLLIQLAPRDFQFEYFKNYLIGLLCINFYTDHPSLLNKENSFLDTVEVVVDIYLDAENYFEERQLVQSQTLDKLISVYENLFEQMQLADLPFTVQQSNDVNQELKHIEHIKLLEDRSNGQRTIQHPTLNKNKKFSGLLTEAGMHLMIFVGPYNVAAQQKFTKILREIDKLFETTLGITNSERINIVQAFGKTVGRWFKCKNGHIYVVTECGGPTQVGTCHECGVEIGGRNHSLVPENEFAPEMDGAEVPLYPTALMPPRRFGGPVHRNDDDD